MARLLLSKVINRASYLNNNSRASHHNRALLHNSNRASHHNRALLHNNNNNNKVFPHSSPNDKA